ncbi:hypothetical protein PIB30_082706 [Stylosanthes scabra]|uniref:Uncharacterized protein n=1 Tax=Stylosanthes scabra TaxID=79078 RepID=A0ABU6TTG0_9FABA|nr:hypothetical protein [Stylosanthes scabra]
MSEFSIQRSITSSGATVLPRNLDELAKKLPSTRATMVTRDFQILLIPKTMVARLLGSRIPSYLVFLRFSKKLFKDFPSSKKRWPRRVSPKLTTPLRPLETLLLPKKAQCLGQAAGNSRLGAFRPKVLLRKLANPTSQLYEFGVLFWTNSKPRIWQSNTSKVQTLLQHCTLGQNGPKSNKRQRSNPSQLLQLKRNIPHWVPFIKDA